MSDPEHGPTAEPTFEKPPYRWIRVMLGLGVSVAVGVYCLVVLSQYFVSRPVDLDRYTVSLADVVQQALEDNRVPLSQISRGEPTHNATQEAFWYTFPFDVNVPPTVDAKGLAQLLGREMLRYSASMCLVSDDGSQTEWAISLGQHEFARVRLMQKIERSDLTAACANIANEVAAALAKRDVPAEAIVRSDPELLGDERTIWCLTTFESPTPASETPDSFAALLDAELAALDITTQTRPGPEAKTTVVLTYRGAECVNLVLGPALEPVGPPEVELATLPAVAEAPAPEPPRPRVAVILDDGGYGAEVDDAALTLDSHVTLSILPGADESAATAKRAGELGFEVILHLPMERADFPVQLTTDMTAEEMAKVIEEALAQVPGAVGINNHMGSVFTANADAMHTFLTAIKDQPLYFIDSRTTPRTKAYDIAQELGIPSAHRNVFLDNESNPMYIRGQFDELVDVAREKGYAIGIGHFRVNTVEVLAKLLPKLKDKGIDLVPASKVVQ
ncbi:MAG: hypothetical protein GWP08_02755 [Nitrospiraceae bacterium]|nr:hypothetical protein [Nitrospiraceae bacterium]